MADDVFTSPYYERLETALARYEAAGHLAADALNALAPKLTPGEDQADPAAQLAAMLDQATTQLPRGRGRSRSVAGLIAIPAEPINEDIQPALTDRQVLIETAARNLVREAQEAGAAWLARLGKPPAQPRQREQWLARAATVALYRYRYEITGAAPLGDARAVATADQAAEYRAAQTALARAKRVAMRPDKDERWSRHASPREGRRL